MSWYRQARPETWQRRWAPAITLIMNQSCYGERPPNPQVQDPAALSCTWRRGEGRWEAGHPSGSLTHHRLGEWVGSRLLPLRGFRGG